MSRYRRVKIEGGLFFFTVALADRSSDLLVRQIERLRRSYKTTQDHFPFDTAAICILPNHLHALWQLPDGDAHYASRWGLLKSTFHAACSRWRIVQRASSPSARRAFGSDDTGST
jgi:putative transposase